MPNRSWPNSTGCAFSTRTSTTLPLTSDLISFINFIASTMQTVVSGETLLPSLTYGSLPKSNDAAFAADGDYKVCVQLTDAAGNTGAASSALSIVESSAGTNHGKSAWHLAHRGLPVAETGVRFLVPHDGHTAIPVSAMSPVCAYSGSVQPNVRVAPSCDSPLTFDVDHVAGYLHPTHK